MSTGTEEKRLPQPDRPVMNRRTFLLSAAGIGVAVGLGGLESHATLLRPPGGQSEHDLLARCIRCGKCEEVCHTNAVVLAKVEDGVLQSRTPKLNFHLGYCDLCMDCVAVCPTEALSRVNSKNVQLGIAKIQEQVCIAWDWSGCTKCVEACKPKAITLDALKRPIVDAQKCNGCGQCEYVCPASELRSYKQGQTRGVVVIPMLEARKNLASISGAHLLSERGHNDL